MISKSQPDNIFGIDLNKTTIGMSKFQEERRNIIKEFQKNNRESILSKARELLMQCKKECSTSELDHDKGDDDNGEYTNDKTHDEENSMKMIIVNSNIDDATANHELIEEIAKGMEEGMVFNDKLKPNQSIRKTKSHPSQDLLYYSYQFTIPEWLISIPPNLCENYWYVLAKPDGVKCLVITKEGRSIARNKKGEIFLEFSSLLPGGSQATNSRNTCVLECVFDNKVGVFYIMDLLIWKDILHLASSSELRFFYIKEHIITNENITKFSKDNPFIFKSIPRFDCNTQGLKKAYESSTSYIKDGLLFYHKEANYIQGPNPYILAWKDSYSSLYPIDTPDGMIDPDMKVVVRLDKEGRLITHDEFIIGKITKEKMDENEWRKNDLIRVTLVEPSMNDMCDETKDSFQFKGLKDFKKISKKRGNADMLSRIIYQYMMRTKPITFSQLYQDIYSIEKIQDLPPNLCTS